MTHYELGDLIASYGGTIALVVAHGSSLYTSRPSYLCFIVAPSDWYMCAQGSYELWEPRRTDRLMSRSGA